MKTTIVKALSRLNSNGLFTFMYLVVTRLTGNLFFPTTSPTKEEVKTKADAIKAAYEAAKTGNKQDKALRNQLTREGKEMMSLLADNIQDRSDGDDVKILSTGFGVRKPSEPVTSIEAPRNLKVSSPIEGEAHLHMRGSKHAKGYIPSYSLDGIVWIELEFTTKLKNVFTGLESGSLIYYRACAVGSIGRSAWSATVRVAVS